MNIGLSLGGGGAKGSYELGVLEAIYDLNIEYNIVTGTSIGSLNGALAVTKNIDLLIDLWTKIESNGVLEALSSEQFSLDKATLLKRLKNENTPENSDNINLKKLISTYIDEESMRKSQIDFGLVTVLFPSLKPLELSIRNIPYGKICDYLVASCSIFPAFPMHKIDESLHIDGGYYDNVPINLAINMGADYVIAVDLFERPAHSNYTKSPLVKYIKPTINLSPILRFDQNLITKNRKLGYNDTLKAFTKVFGFRYTFINKDTSSLNDIALKFAKKILIFEAKIPEKRKIFKKFIRNPLSNSINEYTQKNLSTFEFFVRGLEITMEFLNISHIKAYNIHDVNKTIIRQFLNKSSYNYTELFKNITKLPIGVDSKYLIGCILFKMIENDEFSDNMFWLAMIFPKETISAFYIWSLIS